MTAITVYKTLKTLFTLLRYQELIEKHVSVNIHHFHQEISLQLFSAILQFFKRVSIKFQLLNNTVFCDVTA